MFKCKICAQKFKSMQALGGHTSTAHRQKQAEASSTPPAVGNFTTSEAEPSETEQAEHYLKLGYSFSQLTTILGFEPTTVRQVMARLGSRKVRR